MKLQNYNNNNNNNNNNNYYYYYYYLIPLMLHRKELNVYQMYRRAAAPSVIKNDQKFRACMQTIIRQIVIFN